MRIIKEEYIKEEFVKAVNEVIKNKKGIIDEAKKILDKLDNVDELKKELAKKEEKMQEIRLVNRAKWLLISKDGLTEDEAHHRIEKLAMDRCITKREIAEYIIMTKE